MVYGDDDLQEHVPPQEAFDVPPSPGADQPDTARALANDDAFLGIPIDDDLRLDLDQAILALA
jgi:hypothetical protein